MAESDDVLRHPPVPGDAELRESPIVVSLTNRHIRRKIKAPIAAICDLAEDSTMANTAARPISDRFTQQDDRWNPQLPIWRGGAT